MDLWRRSQMKFDDFNIKEYIDLKATEYDYRLHNEFLRDIIDKFVDLNKELQNALETVTYMSITDPLTKIYNRAKFTEELTKFQEKKQDIYIIMLDIDHFKRVNDTYGHDSGDYVLKKLCELVNVSIKDDWIFARWGGEEFIIIAQGDEEEIISEAEIIRKRIMNFTFDKVGKITSSFGIASSKGIEEYEKVIKKADLALYDSKENGRNRITYNK
jgi:diguanylate cyclase (GGDEF)-like protein